MHGHIETSSYHRMRNLTIKCQPECEFNLNEQVSTHPQSKHGSSRKTISTRKHWGCSREVSNLVSVSSSEVLTELIPCCYHRGKPTTTRHPSCCDERVLKITRKRQLSMAWLMGFGSTFVYDLILVDPCLSHCENLQDVVVLRFNSKSFHGFCHAICSGSSMNLTFVFHPETRSLAQSQGILLT